MNEQEWAQLKASFPYVDFTAEFERAFRAMWEEKVFKKGDFVTEAGRKERYFYFVFSGVQSIYLIEHKGDRIVFGFTYKGDFSGVYASFVADDISDYFLECLSDSRLYAINRANYFNLFEQHPSFNKWGRLFYQQILLGRHKREVELLMLTAKERYLKFIKRCPDELRNIPQKFLASYLYMKPETISRMRSLRIRDEG